MELLFLGVVILLIVIVFGIPKGRHHTDEEARQQADAYDPESDRDAHVNAYIDAVLDKYHKANCQTHGDCLGS